MPPHHLVYPSIGISVGSAVFCGAQERDQETDIQTDHANSVCRSRSHLAIAAMWHFHNSVDYAARGLQFITQFISIIFLQAALRVD